MQALKRTFGVHVIARPSRTNPSISSVFLRISLDKKRIEISLKTFIPTQYWDNKNGKVINHPQVAPDIPVYIERCKAKVWTIYKELTLLDDDFELPVLKINSWESRKKPSPCSMLSNTTWKPRPVFWNPEP
jgi:hypothetical protein